MSNTQETVELKLPISGKTVTLRGFITGRIDQEIQNVFLNDTDIEADSKGGQAMKMKASLTQLANNKAIELIVLSIDGNTENVLDQVLDLHSVDYKAVVAKVNEVSGPADPKVSTK